METVLQFIDNRSVEPSKGDWFESINPYTREPWTKVAHSIADVDRAVSAARRAFDSGPWPRMSPAERAEYLMKWADLIERDLEDLATRDTRDMGKPIVDSCGYDIPRTKEYLRFYSAYIQTQVDESFGGKPQHIYTRFDPVGVVAAVSPWNFPAMLGMSKIAPALAFGNTVVLKPAEQAPASCARLAELAADAGIPTGVLNVIHGYGPDDVGEQLVQHPGVDLVAFTGASATGKAILRGVADGLKRVSFELGGNGSTVIFADADVDRAVQFAAMGVFSNAGQICLSGTRVMVEAEIFDDVVSRLSDHAESLVLGDPMSRETRMGPLVSEEQLHMVSSYLDGALKDGAKLITGGPGEGWFLKPTILTGVPMSACKEEIFGPIARVVPFRTEEEAIAMSNDTNYGLNCSVYTQSIDRALRVSPQLQAGTIWVNTVFTRDLRAPFGGIGESGVGREGGRYSREFFAEPRTIVLSG